MSASQTMTTIQSLEIQKPPRFLRLVGSSSPSDRIPSQHFLNTPSSSEDHTSSVAQEQVPKTHQQSYPLHTSFDREAEYLSPDCQKSSKSDRLHSLQIWLRRTYYQYEVTWGLYVLTPAEKVIVNSFALLMFTLVLYGAGQITFLQFACAWLLGIVRRWLPQGMHFLKH